MAERRHSRSSIALDTLLDIGGEKAEAIRKSTIHRTVLWRYRTGLGKPDVESAALLERLSGGEVAANGWEDLPAAVVAELIAQRRRESSSALKAAEAPLATGTDDPSGDAA